MNLLKCSGSRPLSEEMLGWDDKPDPDPLSKGWGAGKERLDCKLTGGEVPKTRPVEATWEQ